VRLIGVIENVNNGQALAHARKHGQPAEAGVE
jgi:hypothetical protein